jgi:enamine deaminase RidA (YjgF/YER057c/UK114 family)
MPGVDDERIRDRLRELGIELPPPPAAIAAYIPCVVHGPLAFVAGQIAMTDGVVLHPGSLGERVSLDEGLDAARRAALQALSALRDALGGSFERLERILQVTVFVASVPGFVDHPKVANGASELVAEILGDAGRHARAAVGVSSLPLDAPVELVITAAVTPA